MSYNTNLENKIEDIIECWGSIEKKKMFGGICYLLNGNMCFGIWKDCLIVRMAPELAADKLKDERTRAFDITGKPMKGWVIVEKGSWHKKEELTAWLDIGRSLSLSLPKKLSKGKSPEEISYRSNKRMPDNRSRFG